MLPLLEEVIAARVINQPAFWRRLLHRLEYRSTLGRVKVAGPAPEDVA
jgi:hypothetical protein